MPENFLTADYCQIDDPYTITMLFSRRTTAELTALAAAKTVGVGTLYYDTNQFVFKLGIDNTTVSGGITFAGSAGGIAITGGTINGTSIGLTTPAAGIFTYFQLNQGIITNATTRTVNTTAALAAITITAVQTTYIATPAAAITVTLNAPTGDGDRRRIVFGAATTVTWAVTAPATSATPLKTVFAAGEAIELIYNSVAGTPTNSAATTWYIF